MLFRHAPSHVPLSLYTHPVSDLLITLGILIVLGMGLAVLLWPRKRRLDSAAKARITAAWQHAVNLPDPHRRVMEGDKVLDHLLAALGYKGTLGEKLKRADRILPDKNGAWRAHKLRNRLAHEPGAQVSPKEEAEAMAAFERVVRKFTQ